MTDHTPGPWTIYNTGSISMIVPAMRDGMIADLVASDADAFLIAAAPDLLEALLNVRKLISEAAATGFNYKDGDWPERLYFSQQETSAAIDKARGV